MSSDVYGDAERNIKKLDIDLYKDYSNSVLFHSTILVAKASKSFVQFLCCPIPCPFVRFHLHTSGAAVVWHFSCKTPDVLPIHLARMPFASNTDTISRLNAETLTKTSRKMQKG